MTSDRLQPSERTFQLRVVAGMSLVALVAAGLLHSADPKVFSRYLGTVHPVIVFGLIGVLAIGGLRWLTVRCGFVVHGRGTVQGLIRYAALVVLMASVSVVVDLAVPFPADLNVLWPESLVFYPVIAFLVEILFHVLPVTLFLLVLVALRGAPLPQSAAWIAIVVVSLLEPVYQSLDMVIANRFPTWVILVVGANVMFFNALQLFVFKRYDFVSMYAMRLLYYLVWHIGWGLARVPLLFS